jgi:hypothetical protein
MGEKKEDERVRYEANHSKTFIMPIFIYIKTKLA